MKDMPSYDILAGRMRQRNLEKLIGSKTISATARSGIPISANDVLREGSVGGDPQMPYNASASFPVLLHGQSKYRENRKRLVSIAHEI